MSITLTEKAANYIQKHLTQRGKGSGVRLGIKPAGCSGFGYVLEYVDTPEEFDSAFESNGVKIFVDKKSLTLIDGTELDFVRQGMNEGFKFNNPNEKGKCGCGESFTV